ncbi:MAG: type II secretion system minor pseudopilin GspJ [Gammaproteobacteria bacterium]|nr:type II secretion system minor pseudopilin GspJ [Gammaproteobacteria bacterium]
MTRARGFTLLELVVVLAIFSVLSVMAYGGLSSVLRTRDAVEQALRRTGEYQKAYTRLRGDLQQVRNRPVRDGYGETQPAVLLTQDGYLEVTRGGWRNPLALPRSSLERLSYRLEEKKLIRASWRVLDRAQDSQPVETVLLDRVQEASWRFLDAQREWQTSWPPEAQTGRNAASAPPLAIELNLKTEDWGELVLLFRIGLEQRPP